MDTNQIQTRKNFLSLAISTAALFTAFRFFIPAKKKPAAKSGRVKMLTQEGKLVEVDASNFHSATGKKINEEQLKVFVHKRQSKI